MDCSTCKLEMFETYVRCSCPNNHPQCIMCNMRCNNRCGVCNQETTIIAIRDEPENAAILAAARAVPIVNAEAALATAGAAAGAAVGAAAVGAAAVEAGAAAEGAVGGVAAGGAVAGAGAEAIPVVLPMPTNNPQNVLVVAAPGQLVDGTLVQPMLHNQFMVPQAQQRLMQVSLPPSGSQMDAAQDLVRRPQQLGPPRRRPSLHPAPVFGANVAWWLHSPTGPRPLLRSSPNAQLASLPGSARRAPVPANREERSTANGNQWPEGYPGLLESISRRPINNPMRTLQDHGVVPARQRPVAYPTNTVRTVMPPPAQRVEQPKDVNEDAARQEAEKQRRAREIASFTVKRHRPGQKSHRSSRHHRSTRHRSNSPSASDREQRKLERARAKDSALEEMGQLVKKLRELNKKEARKSSADRKHGPSNHLSFNKYPQNFWNGNDEDLDEGSDATRMAVKSTDTSLSSRTASSVRFAATPPNTPCDHSEANEERPSTAARPPKKEHVKVGLTAAQKTSKSAKVAQLNEVNQKPIRIVIESADVPADIIEKIQEFAKVEVVEYASQSETKVETVACQSSEVQLEKDSKAKDKKTASNMKKRSGAEGSDDVAEGKDIEKTARKVAIAQPLAKDDAEKVALPAEVKKKSRKHRESSVSRSAEQPETPEALVVKPPRKYIKQKHPDREFTDLNDAIDCPDDACKGLFSRYNLVEHFEGQHDPPLPTTCIYPGEVRSFIIKPYENFQHYNRSNYVFMVGHKATGIGFFHFSDFLPVVLMTTRINLGVQDDSNVFNDYDTLKLWMCGIVPQDVKLYSSWCFGSENGRFKKKVINLRVLNIQNNQDHTKIPPASYALLTGAELKKAVNHSKELQMEIAFD